MQPQQMIQNWEDWLIYQVVMLSEGSGQAEDMGEQESRQVEQREMQSPALGKQ